MCSMLAHVENGRVVRIQGDAANPRLPAMPAPRSTATTSWCIPKTPGNPLAPDRAQGEGKFAPIGWDEALDEITTRWQAIIAESGPLACSATPTARTRGR